MWITFYLGGLIAFVGLILSIPKNEKPVPIYVSFVWFIIVPIAFIRLLKRGVTNG